MIFDCRRALRKVIFPAVALLAALIIAPVSQAASFSSDFGDQPKHAKVVKKPVGHRVGFILPSPAARSAISTENNNYFYSCGNGCITGLSINSFNALMFESAGMLADANAWAGLNTWSGVSNFTGTFKVGGYAMTFPSVATTLVSQAALNTALPSTSALYKGTGSAGVAQAASAGTDYVSPNGQTSALATALPLTSALYKGTGGAGTAQAATPGTDYITPAEQTSALAAALPSITTNQLYGGTGGAGVAQLFPAGTGVPALLEIVANAVGGLPTLPGSSCNGTNNALNFTANSALGCKTDVASLSGTDQTLGGGANVTAYNPAAGNVTVDCGNGPLQYQFNAGAFTITAPANNGSCILEVINASGSSTNPNGGAVTLANFSPKSPGGATFANTLTQSGVSVTFTNANPTVVSWTSHGMTLNSPVYFTAATMPTGITADQVYYVCNVVTSGTFQICSSPVSATTTGIAATSTGTTVLGDEPSVFDLSIARVNGQAYATWAQVQ